MMGIQDIIVSLIFLAALYVFGRRIFISALRKGCASGCASCKPEAISKILNHENLRK